MVKREKRHLLMSCILLYEALNVLIYPSTAFLCFGHIARLDDNDDAKKILTAFTPED